MPRKRPRISDNPSIRKVREQTDGLKLLAKLSPFLKPFGIQVDYDFSEKVDDLDRKLGKMESLPDRFNDLFSNRGWIAYEMLKADVMEKAVELGEAGDLDAAEQVLSQHFDEDTIEWGIKFMWAIDAFRPRKRLTRLAQKDYLEERYHACVPVLITIIDGLVNDISKSKGFFAEGTDLTAWDSIAAHDRGLATLATLWRQGRKRTTTEPIYIPFRHGILHGRDLEYDNRLVAAKLWAALFALREWALAVRDNRVDEPPPEPNSTLREMLNRRRQSQEDRAYLDAWNPRSDDELAAIPRSGEPDEYEEGSPERAVAELMTFWKRRNYGDMAKLHHTPLSGPLQDRRIGRLAGDLRQTFQVADLVGFEILEVEDLAASRSTARVRALYEYDGQNESKDLDLELLYLGADGELAVRGKAEGIWTIQNLWSIHLGSR